MAGKILGEVVKSGQTSTILQRTYEYLNSVSKCSAEDASKIVEELDGLLSKEETKVMIASICPKTHEELRTLLTLEGKTYTTEELDRVLEIVRKYVKS
ncbi:DNA-directed RNA polymerase subunit F [Sulfodiicoccus acidiphilus]|uniref:DNA-directed RNA polymerase subunit Rpo4 n=1 Tax=Sulfodiicoccus acidiphilus TaxID=1670455 RepID=A0A348B0V3_9CREN|nr:DNA-directed RNA polymerase subunit F [Sulfodiicoccus acidiphilus]GGT99302.1 DNA-directed RNA polymerase subunit F [Sulfodiicoccus acidiphilus]